MRDYQVLETRTFSAGKYVHIVHTCSDVLRKDTILGRFLLELPLELRYGLSKNTY